MSQQRLHATIYGRVQGVSFRHYTVQTAQRLNLSGWVRNNSDGTVEVTAEGDSDGLDKLEAFLHNGSPAAEVERVQSERGAATGEFVGFNVRYGGG